jgi:hypothetical protein
MRCFQLVVFPVFVTGHHCGAGGSSRPVIGVPMVFLVFVTGHHCGRSKLRESVAAPDADISAASPSRSE